MHTEFGRARSDRGSISRSPVSTHVRIASRHRKPETGLQLEACPLLLSSTLPFFTASGVLFRLFMEPHRVLSPVADKKFLFSYVPDWCLARSSLPRDYIQGILTITLADLPPYL
jgi:hypothetical protein